MREIRSRFRHHRAGDLLPLREEDGMITARDPRHLYQYAGVANILSSPEAVDGSSVAAYHRDGFLAVEGLLTEAEVDTAQQAVEDLIFGRVPGFAGIMPEPEHE